MRKIYNLFLSVIMLLATIQLSAQDFVAQITDANMTILITEGYSGDVELAGKLVFFIPMIMVILNALDILLIQQVKLVIWIYHYLEKRL